MRHECSLTIFEPSQEPRTVTFDVDDADIPDGVEPIFDEHKQLVTTDFDIKYEFFRHLENESENSTQVSEKVADYIKKVEFEEKISNKLKRIRQRRKMFRQARQLVKQENKLKQLKQKVRVAKKRFRSDPDMSLNELRLLQKDVQVLKENINIRQLFNIKNNTSIRIDTNLKNQSLNECVVLDDSEDEECVITETYSKNVNIDLESEDEKEPEPQSKLTPQPQTEQKSKVDVVVLDSDSEESIVEIDPDEPLSMNVACKKKKVTFVDDVVTEDFFQNLTYVPVSTENAEEDDDDTLEENRFKRSEKSRNGESATIIETKVAETKMETENTEKNETTQDSTKEAQPSTVALENETEYEEKVKEWFTGSGKAKRRQRRKKSVAWKSAGFENALLPDSVMNEVRRNYYSNVDNVPSNEEAHQSDQTVTACKPTHSSNTASDAKADYNKPDQSSTEHASNLSINENATISPAKQSKNPHTKEVDGSESSPKSVEQMNTLVNYWERARPAPRELNSPRLTNRKPLQCVGSLLPKPPPTKNKKKLRRREKLRKSRMEMEQQNVTVSSSTEEADSSTQFSSPTKEIPSMELYTFAEAAPVHVPSLAPAAEDTIAARQTEEEDVEMWNKHVDELLWKIRVSSEAKQRSGQVSDVDVWKRRVDDLLKKIRPLSQTEKKSSVKVDECDELINASRRFLSESSEKLSSSPSCSAHEKKNFDTRADSRKPFYSNWERDISAEIHRQSTTSPNPSKSPQTQPVSEQPASKSLTPFVSRPSAPAAVENSTKEPRPPRQFNKPTPPEEKRFNAYDLGNVDWMSSPQCQSQTPPGRGRKSYCSNREPYSNARRRRSPPRFNPFYSSGRGQRDGYWTREPGGERRGPSNYRGGSRKNGNNGISLESGFNSTRTESDYQRLSNILMEQMQQSASEPEPAPKRTKVPDHLITNEGRNFTWKSKKSVDYIPFGGPKEKSDGGMAQSTQNTSESFQRKKEQQFERYFEDVSLPSDQFNMRNNYSIWSGISSNSAWTNRNNFNNNFKRKFVK